MKVDIHFKGGSVASFEADNVTVRTLKTTGEITGIDYSNDSKPVKTNFLYLDSDSVAAVVTTKK